MGPVIAGIILWASTFVHTDHYLAGFVYAACLVLFIIAAATDWLDGYIARKFNAVTPLGAALDHSADKVLIACVLRALANTSLTVWLVLAAVLILGRDIAIAGLREATSAQGKSLPVSQLGKWKAAAEMAGIAAFLAFQTTALLQISASVVAGLFYAAQILLWSAAVLALVSGGLYVSALIRRG
jgi:CDP-diacylglycerol--glycerol-3-phosphate 3-phosphatidyltransferase